MDHYYAVIMAGGGGTRLWPLSRKDRPKQSLKLLGDQSVSRTYRLVAERLYLEEWDASVTRKLKTADNLYHTLADWAATRRVELLEWIIIILIAVSIVIPFVVGSGAH